MGNDRNEKYENHEEGEYHFSDDQINYEMDQPDVVKADESVPPKSKLNLMTGMTNLSPYRRMLIGIVVFLVLIFVVYKTLTPSSNLPATEFNQTAGAPTATAKPKPVMAPAMPHAPAPLPQQVAPTVSEQPASLPMPEATTQPEVPLASQTAQSQVVQNTQQSLPAPTMQPQPMQPPPTAPMLRSQVQNPVSNPAQNQYPQTGAAYTTTAPLPTTPPQGMIVSPVPPTPDSTAIQKNILERLAALEEENAKVMALLQAQFAQKNTDSQAQNNATQERVLILSKRLSNIEASLNKMAQMIREEGVKKPPAIMAVPVALPPVRPLEPKITYTVQAIIPGRAWLKSDAGETVTVAEGDMLKDYGRVIKIDPYDGIVEIDTGSKTISLAYGTGGD